MRKLVFAVLTLLAIGLIAPSCGGDDFQNEEITLPEAPAPSNDGNNEGDPDGGD